MFYLFSKGCEYAIRALLYVAQNAPDEHFSLKKVCRKVKIPEQFTRKVFQSLVHRGLLESVTGPGGGYRLKQRPHEITLLDIIQAAEGKETYERCVMGLPQCGELNPCPLHALWKTLRHKICSKLDSKTLDQLKVLEKSSGRKEAL